MWEIFPNFDHLKIYQQICSWPQSSGYCDTLPYVLNESIIYAAVPRLWKHSYASILIHYHFFITKEHYIRPASFYIRYHYTYFERIFRKILKNASNNESEIG